MSEECIDQFYEMFTHEFFEPPEEYEYEFGSFTKEDIAEMDSEIDELFEELFGEDESAFGESDSNTTQLNAECILTAVDSAEGENWESEMDYSNEFHLARPVKNIPIGITMNDISGRKFEEKVPLLKYFDTFEATKETKAGFSKMTAKQKKKWNKKVKRPKGGDFPTNMNFDGQGRTYGRTDNRINKNVLLQTVFWRFCSLA